MRATLLPLAVLPAALAGDVIHSDGLIRYALTPLKGAPLAGKNAKRQLAADSVGKRSGTVYTINLTFGTPGQPVPVLIDTGSSELWANPTCSRSADPAFCQTQTRFTYSTTLVDLGTTGHVDYASGPGRQGSVDFVYVADYVGVGCRSLGSLFRVPLGPSA